MPDKLTAIRAAIAEILDDDLVIRDGSGYRVTRGGIEFFVHKDPEFGDWRVYYGTSTPVDLRPAHGVGGGAAAETAEYAVLFVLL